MLPWLLGILGLGGATTAAAIVFPSFGALLALAGKAAVQWLSKRSLGEVVGIVLALLLVVDHLALLSAHRENGKLETQLKDANKATQQASSALAQTVANYRAAAAKAEADDKAKNDRTIAQQQQINKEQSDEYQARIAASRVLIQRLQQAIATTAHSGGSSGPGVPSIPTPACGTDAPSIDPATRAYDCAIQLDELIKWVERQHAIDPNK